MPNTERLLGVLLGKFFLLNNLHPCLQATTKIFISHVTSLHKQSPVTTADASYFNAFQLSINTGIADYLWYMTSDAAILECVVYAL